MANVDHLSILRQGVRRWNQWREQNPDVRPELSGAILRRAHLPGALLNGANLHGADFLRADLHAANLSGARLRRAYLRGTNLQGANITAAELKYATLAFTNLEGAILTDCFVYGISVWGVNLSRAEQSNLVITPKGESVITVDNLEVAQFIYLLLNNSKIREVIDTIGRKAVLILGRFSAERKLILNVIREKLRQCAYLPILFDFENSSSRDTQETVVTLASLARFVIADITDPRSVPQELIAIVPNLPSVPVQPLLQAGYQPWSMFDHLERFHWVLPPFVYENRDMLSTQLEEKVIAPAEAKAKAQTGR